MKKQLAAGLLAVASLGVQADTAELDRYLTIGSREVVLETTTNKGTFASTMVEEVDGRDGRRSTDRRDRRGSRTDDSVFFDVTGAPADGGIGGAVATAGQVIQVGRDLVALGEELYALVKKGEPVIRTDYAPISVVPRSNGVDAVDVLAETENWSMPKAQRMVVNYKNLYGVTVVRFEYTLVFSYGGTFNGAGSYITAAQVVPTNFHASFGFEFESSMRLSGIQNHGTSLSPVAGAMINVQYKVKSLMSAQETNDTYHITGRGQVRKI